MELLLTPFLIVGLLLFGPFIALNAYVMVWLCGPAIRRAGRCWEQGRQQANWGFVMQVHPTTPPALRMVNPGVAASPPQPTRAPAPAREAESAPDSGHRWLGGPGGKVA